jgi:hypothetical protein
MSNELPELPDDLRAYLADLISDDRERKLAHLRWLDADRNEPDRDEQIAATEAALAVATRAAAFFPPTVD